MNNSFVLNRIKSQMNQSTYIETKVETKEEVKKEEIKETPVSPEELRNELKKEIIPQEISTEVRIFSGVEDFVCWYIPLKDKFSPNQIAPLTTLVQVNTMINQGCNCKRAQRIKQANDYYAVFWEKNKNTDLPDKVLEVGGFKTIIFSTPENPEFLKFSIEEE